MTQAITTTSTPIPAELAEFNSYADVFMASGMFPAVKNKATAVVKMMAGAEYGLDKFRAMRDLHIIGDKVVLGSDAMAYLVKKSGKYTYIVDENTDTSCVITFYEIYGDQRVKIGTSGFTIKDAERAGLINRNPTWKSYPRNMLFARALAAGARTHCPDALGGIYGIEEAESITTSNYGPPAGTIEAVNETAGEIVAGSSDAMWNDMGAEKQAITAKDAIKTEPTITEVYVIDDPASVVPPKAKDEEQMYGFVPKKLIDEAKAKLKKSWPETQMYAYVKDKYMVSASKFTDLVAKLSKEQADEFSGEIQDRLMMAGVTV